MISTGTFLELTIKVDTDPIPVILGKTKRGYFICLPNHDAAFELKHAEDVDEENFICYMDGVSAQMVAGIVKQALGLLFYCGGALNYL